MFVVRIFLGLVFLLSGLEKVISPYQNFLYTLQFYQFFPDSLIRLVAIIFPWLELFVGLFLVLGLWTPWAIRCAAVLFGGFIIIVGQALLRGLPIDQCGCFGELIHIPPKFIIIADSFMLLGCIMLLKKLPQTQKFSCDAYFK